MNSSVAIVNGGAIFGPNRPLRRNFLLFRATWQEYIEQIFKEKQGVGAGSGEQGAGSREQGAGSRESRAEIHSIAMQEERTPCSHSPLPAPTPCSPLPAPCSHSPLPAPTPRSLLPAPRSLLPAPRSLLPAPRSLLPAPCSE